MPREDDPLLEELELVLEEDPELDSDRALDEELELGCDRVVVRLLEGLDVLLRFTEELRLDEESGRAVDGLRLGSELRSGAVVRGRVVVEGLLVVGDDDGAVRVDDGDVRLDGAAVELRSVLPLLSVEPRGTSRAPPIESMTRSGTVSRQFRSCGWRSLPLVAGVVAGAAGR